ncbi:CNT_collapsed_G0015720.mRNA.1.CDS.1 [Saccharomyces cerevisiae]|nr:CNT_collapsed_G0015720.mRNA.1.CDS.1 [Saccharomyces cerevisiae]
MYKEIFKIQYSGGFPWVCVFAWAIFMVNCEWLWFKEVFSRKGKYEEARSLLQIKQGHSY